MVDRTIRLSDDLAAKVRVASASMGLSSQQFIVAATSTAIATMADHDPIMRLVFEQVTKPRETADA
jgi:hypothetical protein